MRLLTRYTSRVNVEVHYRIRIAPSYRHHFLVGIISKSLTSQCFLLMSLVPGF